MCVETMETHCSSKIMECLKCMDDVRWKSKALSSLSFEDHNMIDVDWVPARDVHVLSTTPTSLLTTLCVAKQYHACKDPPVYC